MLCLTLPRREQVLAVISSTWAPWLDGPCAALCCLAHDAHRHMASCGQSPQGPRCVSQAHAGGAGPLCDSDMPAMAELPLAGCALGCRQGEPVAAAPSRARGSTVH